MPVLPPPRLLVVDDEAPLMAALRSTLRDEGYDVTGALSGDEALAALRSGSFDILLTDLMMPNMDGIALLREALALDPHLSAILMTGHGSVPTAVEAMKTGAIDYVLKPFKLSALLLAVERGMTMRRLRLQNVELERRVQARTAELEKANRELDAFCASVAHDLRTPLRAILGFSEILRDYHAEAMEPEPDIKNMVDLIHSGAFEMNRLISDLLAFARLGRQAITRKPVDLNALFREAYASLEAERKDRRIEFKLGPLPAVLGDPAMIKLVAVNLLSNAIKYSRPRDPAIIEVGVDPEGEEPTPVLFVRDNGVGFSMRDADRLFNVFSRLHHAHEFEGTGVGLASISSIIERHGGRIWAEAERDKGATFFFTLPGELSTP